MINDNPYLQGAYALAGHRATVVGVVDEEKGPSALDFFLLLMLLPLAGAALVYLPSVLKERRVVGRLRGDAGQLIGRLPSRSKTKTTKRELLRAGWSEGAIESARARMRAAEMSDRDRKISEAVERVRIAQALRKMKAAADREKRRSRNQARVRPPL